MKLILGNIVKLQTDAIACPAHSDLQPIPGIREAVFRAADREKLTELCRRRGRCPIGNAVVTPSCGLPCKYIVHVVGPGWYSGRKTDRYLFASCYLHALHGARVYRCQSIALPLMFSGESHLPRAEALTIVCQVVEEFEKHHPEMEILLVLYKESIYHLAEKIYGKVKDGTLKTDRRTLPPRGKF